jgi:phosphoglycolate phosphatase
MSEGEQSPAMKYGVIFDLDRTLLDTMKDVAASLNRALLHLGYPGHDFLAYQRMVGDGIAKMLEKALPDGLRDGERVAALREAFLDAYARRLTKGFRPHPGMKELLGDLKGMEWPLGALSDNEHGQAVSLVEDLFPGLFDAVLGSTQQMNKPMPDPTRALALAGFLGLQPNEVFYVGGSHSDMILAENAGFIPIGAAWGFWSPLNMQGAKATIGSPGELLEIIPTLIVVPM